jgi:two-component system, NtrC family, sensor kinase
VAALTQLRHADRLANVGKLASGIAHELGTPLNVIGGWGRMIAARELEDAEAADGARIIVDQAERMTRIIRQLLDFARRRSPRKELLDLRTPIAQSLALLAPLAEKRHARFEQRLPAEPALVQADAAQLQQVLTNLLVNAVQAMPSGGRIEAALYREKLVPPPDSGAPPGEYFCIEVQDEGTGMSEEVLGRVFEPFFTTKEPGEGTGLGLSVSQGIAQEHGGWIALESKPGAGSRFRVYLPPGAEA